LRNFAAIIFLWLSTATTTFAGDACSAEVSIDDLVGNYTISLGPGSLTVVSRKGGERIHEVPLKTGTATIALHDNVPFLYTDDLAEGGVMDIALRLAGNSDKTTTFLEDPAFPAMSAEDTAIVLNCESALSLPQLIGTGTVTGNGAVVPNSVQLMVYAQDDGGISAVGAYESTVVSEATGGHLVFHLRISISPL
jgi:hypothetical protein